MTAANDVMVRMGEYEVGQRGPVLTTIGLGSCIGLALVDVTRGVAGLAHIMLPESPSTGDDQLGKYADTAVPAVLGRVIASGARRTSVDAVLVGGAQMFSFGAGALDVGARNEAAVRSALAKVRVPIKATATGGSTGRTIRVDPATGVVTVRVARAPEVELFAPASAAGRHMHSKSERKVVGHGTRTGGR